MEPRIQYAQTADGVSIAFWTVGEGMPLVVMPELPWSHIQLEWQNPNARRWYELLAEKRMVVRYDSRGTGMSARDAVDFTLDSQMADLDAVAQRLGLASLALYAPVNSGPAAIAYAARYPKRVSRLVLCNAWARSSDWSRSPQMKALRGLLGRDWETYTETYAHILYGWSEAETAQQVARQMREGMTEEAMLAWADAVRGFDVTECLPQVRVPTLVVQGAQRTLDVDVARHLASRMPDARLVLFEEAAGVPFRGETDPLLRAIDAFLSEGEEAAAGAVPSGLVTILFTDMEGSTSLTQRLGDAKAQEVLRTHNTIVRDALKAHGGTEIKHTGDGIMASFASASRALECAIDIQRSLAEHNEAAEEPIRVRVGLNAGEPIAEEEDLFGTAVQLAARICAQAAPGEILAPIVVRELAAGKGFLLSDRGDVALRGFEDPVRLFEVRWREDLD